jgi:hypothetical protein
VSELKYFDTTEEYPRLLFTGVELGVWYEYVSSYWIQVALHECGTRPEAMWLLVRYRPHDPTQLDVIAKDVGWVDLHDFGDDVVILIRCREDEGRYALLWYDCDVSDCKMGFFEPSPRDDVRALVDEWLRLMASGHEVEEGLDSGVARVFALDVSRLRIGLTIR